MQLEGTITGVGAAGNFYQGSFLANFGQTITVDDNSGNGPQTTPFPTGGGISFTAEAGSIIQFNAFQDMGGFFNTYTVCPERDETGIVTGSIRDDLALEFIGSGCPTGTFQIELVRVHR